MKWSPSLLLHPSGTAHTIKITLTVYPVRCSKSPWLFCDFWFVLSLCCPVHLSHPQLTVCAPSIIVRASAGAPALPGESESLGGPGAELLPGNGNLGVAWSCFLWRADARSQWCSLSMVSICDVDNALWGSRQYHTSFWGQSSVESPNTVLTLISQLRRLRHGGSGTCLRWSHCSARTQAQGLALGPGLCLDLPRCFLYTGSWMWPCVSGKNCCATL